MRVHANPDLGQNFKSQNGDFYEKNVLIGKKHTCEGTCTEAFLKDRKQGFFVNVGLFPCP
jgi:hypothetical protein